MKAFTRTTRKFWYVLRHWRDVWRLVQDDTEHRTQAEALRKQLAVPERVTFSHRPALSWRIAASWMTEYGIVLTDGGAGFDFLARLPKDKWEHDIDPGADPAWYATWFLVKAEEAQSISAWAKWPEIAVAQCVLNAKKAGVI